MIVTTHGFGADARATDRDRYSLWGGSLLAGNIGLDLLGLLLLLLGESRRDDALPLVIQIDRILLVDLPELFRCRVRAGNIEMPVLHKVIIRVAAAGLSPAGKFGVTFGYQSSPAFLRVRRPLGVLGTLF